MNKGSKIAVTILLIIVFFFITALLTAAESSKTLIAMLGLGLFFGIKAMWKKPKEDISTEIKLDKSKNSDSESHNIK